MNDYFVAPGGKLKGSLSVPGDKSISHRALILSAIAEGTSEISGFLEARDPLVTMNALIAMGATIHYKPGQRIIVEGAGKTGLRSPEGILDMGNSGTSARLFAGLLSGLGITCDLTGDKSLESRPMQRVVDPLRSMGADISCSVEGTLPIKIGSSGSLKALKFDMPIASAQLKSSLLLAGLNAQGRTRIYGPVSTRDHTERMLMQFGYQLECSEHSVALEGCQCLRGSHINIPADISSAAFFIVGASIAKGSNITVKNVGVNPTRDAVIDILCTMGADIKLLNKRNISGEPVADIQVQAAPLHGIDIDQALVPEAIDELPAIMVAAACAQGVTKLTGATELRFKESDRIVAIARGLQTLGIDVEVHHDGMTVTGGQLSGGDIDSFGDHRVAMAFAMAALNAGNHITIRNCTNVETSFPNFVNVAKTAGLDLHIQE